jgi:hypothetical protein
VDIRGSTAGIRGRRHIFRPADAKAADVIMGLRKRCGEVALERPSVSLCLGCGEASNRHMVVGSAVGAWGAEQNEHLKAKPCRHRHGYRAGLDSARYTKRRRPCRPGKRRSSTATPWAEWHLQVPEQDRLGRRPRQLVDIQWDVEGRRRNRGVRWGLGQRTRSRCRFAGRLRQGAVLRLPHTEVARSDEVSPGRDRARASRAWPPY